MKACEAQTDDQVAECMKAWRKRGNAMTCVRCRDCTSSECTMYCSNAAHPEAPLRRMDCVDGEDCGDSLESGNHDSIFSNTYNRDEAIAKGKALDEAADTRNAKFRGESCASKTQALRMERSIQQRRRRQRQVLPNILRIKEDRSRMQATMPLG